MKLSNTWSNNIIKYFLYSTLVFLLNCKEDDYVYQPLVVEVLSFKKVNRYNGYCTLVIRNKSDINYILPSIGYVYLTNSKIATISYDDVGKIEGKIVDSDFRNIVGNTSDTSIKIQQIISKYIDFKKNKINFPICYFDDFDRFSHAILFAPKRSESIVTVWFNAQDINVHTLEDKNKKIILSNIHEKFEDKESNFLDSLSLKNHLNYKVYKDILYVRDSLHIRYPSSGSLPRTEVEIENIFE